MFKFKKKNIYIYISIYNYKMTYTICPTIFGEETLVDLSITLVLISEK